MAESELDDDGLDALCRELEPEPGSEAWLINEEINHRTNSLFAS